MAATSTPANMPHGTPVAQPSYLVDATGNPITEANPLPSSATVGDITIGSVTIEDGTTASQKLAVDPAGEIGINNFPSNQRVNAQASDFVDGAIASLGAKADTAASSDGGTFSLIALIKRLLGKIPALGQATKAGSLPVTLASDQGNVAISASSLPLPTGAATAALQAAPGTAGSASADVLSIQGIASMTPVASNVSQVNGAAISATNPLPASLAVGSALAPWGSNPAQTAAAAADTPYKFGGGGSTPGTRCIVQNNTNININLAFDVDSTLSTSAVYTLVPGQMLSFDRSFTVLHFNSASQKTFLGPGGIAIEAFA